LLEAIREYGLERLHAAGEADEYRRRHAAHFLEVAESAWSGILEGGEREAAGFALLDAEQENLHAALSLAVESGDVDTEVRLVCAQRWYWLVRGRLNEGVRVFEHAIEVSGERPAAHASVLAGAATYNVRLGDRVKGRAQLEAALDLYRGIGDEGEAARCIAELGHVAVDEGELERAFELYTECAAVFERLGNRTRQGVALSNLAAISARRGDAATAAEHGRHAIELQRANGDIDGTAVSLANLGRVLLELDDEAGAREAFRESFDLGRRLDYQMLLAYLLGASGELARRAGEPERAGRLIGAATALFEAIGMEIPAEELHEHERTLGPLRDELGEEAVLGLLEEGRRVPVDEAIADGVALTA
jgi:tetratricopeptide (TPR) repeat protein